MRMCIPTRSLDQTRLVRRYNVYNVLGLGLFDGFLGVVTREGGRAVV